MPKPSIRDEKRMPYLDGLRGYSILTVIILHSVQHFSTVPVWLGPLNLLFGNGGLGVQIFFALSGFLISTLLFQEYERTGGISLRKFYVRRVARIFPAAYFFIAIVVGLKLIHLLNLQWKTILPASAFCQNYGIVLGLVQGSPDHAVLGHFWSLSLEEQFYLFWPGCLVLLGIKRSRFVAIFAVLAVPIFRFVTYIYVPNSHQQLLEMFQTAADDIFWGALAAYAYQNGQHLLWREKRWLRWATLFWAIFAIFILNFLTTRIGGLNRFLVPSVYGIFAASLILWLLSDNTGVLRRILEWRPLRWVGLLSYSLYIWQQLFIVRTSPLSFNLPLDWLLIFGSASCSYYLVEAPLRRRIRAWLLRDATDAAAAPALAGKAIEDHQCTHY